MRGYFDVLPYIQYGDHEMKDIFRRVIPSRDFENEFVLYEYIVEDGETAESLAYKLYNDVNRHWILLMVNDIIDPYTEWVMSSGELEKYTTEKYGDNNGFHHYEDDTGDIVYDDRASNPALYNLIYVTNINHETALNEEKRSIRVLPFEAVATFEKMFESVI